MRSILAAFITLYPLLSWAQQMINGRVVDARTDEALPFVGVLVKGERQGTSTGIDGRFMLQVTTFPVTVVCSYVGYEPLELVVADAEPLLLRLNERVGELEGVKVKPGENPAHRIIKRTFEGRKENDGLHANSYRYTSYSKTIFAAALDSAIHNDSARYAQLDTSTRELFDLMERQHLFLIESATRKSFVPPAAEKEEVLAMRVSGLKDPSFLGLIAQTKTFSIYDARIGIGEKSYLGPIGPNSWNHYLFILEDTLYQGADSVFVISYRPRKGTKFDGLKGLLWVNTDGYAVQNVIAEPAERDGVSIKFQQMHAPVNGHWFPVQLNSFIYLDNVNVNGMGLFGEGRTYLKDIEVDVDIARKDVRGPELVMDQLSTRRDDDFWNALRTDTLDAKDLRTYHVIDSLGEKAHADRQMKVFAALVSGRVPIGPIDLLLARLGGYNAYEGIRLGLGAATNDRLTRYGSLGGYFAYGFTDQGWKYGGDLTIKPMPGRDFHVRALYANDVEEDAGTLFSGISREYRRDDFLRVIYMDRMDRIERIGAEVHGRVGSSLSYWAGTDRTLRVNERGYNYVEHLDEGITLRRDHFLTGNITLGARFAFRERLARMPDRTVQLGTSWPVLYVQAVRTVEGLYEGDLDSWRLFAMVEKNFRTRLLGTLHMRLMGGLCDENAPYPYVFNMRGNNAARLEGGFFDPLLLATEGVFETMRPNEFANDRYAALFLYHDFGTLLVKGRHFRPRPGIVLNMGVGSLAHPEQHEGYTATGMEDGFAEVGLRVDDLLKSGFNGFGFGVYHRLGAAATGETNYDLAIKLTLGTSF